MSIVLVQSNKAIASLHSYQTSYPDYDAEDWFTSVSEVFRTASVRSVARELANLADWSLRGIEISQADLAKSAGIGVNTASKAIRRLADARFLGVSYRRPLKTDYGYTQKPCTYRLIIPDGPVWNMPDLRPQAPFDASDIPLSGPSDSTDVPWDRRETSGRDTPSPDFSAGTAVVCSCGNPACTSTWLTSLE